MASVLRQHLERADAHALVIADLERLAGLPQRGEMELAHKT